MRSASGFPWENPPQSAAKPRARVPRCRARPNAQEDSASKNDFPSFRSRVSNPSVNHASSSRLLHLALVAPEACEAHCCAEFPGFGLLLTGDGESVLEMLLRVSTILFWSKRRDFASYS